jgi:hypothetical protein
MRDARQATLRRALEWVWALVFVALTTGCAARSQATRMYPDLAEHAGKEVAAVDFLGGEPFPADTLQTLIETQPSRCSILGLPVCIPFTRVGRRVHELGPQHVAEDVARLEAFYSRKGYFGTEVRPEVTGQDQVAITFRIVKGDPIVLDRLTVEGTQNIMDPDSLARALPLQPTERRKSSTSASSRHQPTRFCVRCRRAGTRSCKCCATSRWTRSKIVRWHHWRRCRVRA